MANVTAQKPIKTAVEISEEEEFQAGADLRAQRKAEAEEQELLAAVPCWACGHKGGHRVVRTWPRKSDGATLRVALCPRAGCGFDSRIVQLPGKSPELAPDAEQDEKRLPPTSPRARRMEQMEIARMTAAEALDELTGEKGDFMARLRGEIREAVREAVAELISTADGNGKKK